MYKTVEQMSKKELIFALKATKDFDMFLQEAIGKETYDNIVKAWVKDKCGRESPDIYKMLYGEEYKGKES